MKLENIVSQLRNNEITELSFNGDSIGDEGVKELSKVLEENTSLKFLNILGNYISEKGAE